MRVLLVCDSYFARREHPLLERLEIGLADEGVRLTVALPEATELHEQLSLLSSTVKYRPAGLGWTRRMRGRWLLEQVRSAGVGGGPAGGGGGAGAERIELVHVFGGSAWGVAAEAARLLEAPLMLEVWRMGLAARARWFASRSPGRAVLMAPDPAVERELRRSSGGASVRLAPWGVSSQAEPAAVFREGRVPGVVLLGGGRSGGQYLPALRAAAEWVRGVPDGLLFVDAVAARRTPVWKLTKELGVRGRVSLIEEMEVQRGLVLRADLVLHPEALGEQRTVLLDTMGAGLPLIAREDPGTSVLVDGRTARVVRSDPVEEWRTAIESVAGDRTRARELGASAREWVRENRRSTGYISAVLGTYEWALSAAGPGGGAGAAKAKAGAAKAGGAKAGGA